jgi:hypothetical protein
MSINTFNLFNLQHGAKQWHRKLQEVIYYGESCFRQALSYISKAEPCHLKWMQQALQNELVCALIFLYIAPKH